MKKTFSLISFILVLLFIGCKTKELTPEQQIQAQELVNKIENRRYIFEASRAQPMSSRSIDLTSRYFLRVSPDSIIASLPYFGRSYTAPMNANDIGINFTSTDFLYSSNKKNDGSYEIKIEPKDITNNQNKGIVFFLTISTSGYANINTSGYNRQSISFSGKINE